MSSLGPGDQSQIGGYRILTALGEGSTARALLGVGYDGTPAAVKVLHPRFAADEQYRALFRRNIDAAATVSGPCSAPILNADPDGDPPWVATRYLPGPTLWEAVDAAGPLSVAAVRRLAIDVATALSDTHKAGLAHGDLNPGNVLLTEHGAVVTDAGLGRPGGGSPAFVSPELALGEGTGPAGDVFSLGALLAFAASGHPPFAGTTTRELLQDVVHGDPDLRDVPPEIQQIVTPCLARRQPGRPRPEQIISFLGSAQPGPAAWPAPVQELIRGRQAIPGTTAQTPQPAPAPPAAQPYPEAQPYPGAGQQLPVPRRKPKTGLIVGAVAAVAILLAGAVAAIALFGGSAERIPNTAGTDSGTGSPGDAPRPLVVPVGDPLSLESLRMTDPCAILAGQDPGTGPLATGMDGSADYDSCDYNTPDTHLFSVTIGDSMPSSPDGPPGQTADGIEVSIDDQDSGACVAMVPIPGVDDLGIRFYMSGNGDPCAVALRGADLGVKKIRAGVTQFPGAAGSLNAVDPCAVVDDAVLKSAAKTEGAGTPDGLNGCEWDGESSPSLTFRVGKSPEKSDDPVTPEQIGGVTAYVQKDDDSTTCDIAWPHRTFGESYTENVEISVFNSDASVDANCGVAKEIATSVVARLPQD